MTGLGRGAHLRSPLAWAALVSAFPLFLGLDRSLDPAPFAPSTCPLGVLGLRIVFRLGFRGWRFFPPPWFFPGAFFPGGAPARLLSVPGVGLNWPRCVGLSIRPRVQPVCGRPVARRFSAQSGQPIRFCRRAACRVFLGHRRAGDLPAVANNGRFRPVCGASALRFVVYWSERERKNEAPGAAWRRRAARAGRPG